MSYKTTAGVNAARSTIWLVAGLVLLAIAGAIGDSGGGAAFGLFGLIAAVIGVWGLGSALRQKARNQ